VFDAIVRKSGNSLIVTIPKEEAEHLGLREGSHVRVSAVRLDGRPVLPPDLQEAARDMLADREFVAGLRWLKEQDAGPEGAAPDVSPGGAAPPPRPRPG
jgi:antitoxin component of MazEF toxin-antitoxin module